MLRFPQARSRSSSRTIEGSTKLAREHRDVWESLRERHHTILQSAIKSHNGYIFQIIGDAFCAAFHTACDGLKAALEAQQRLRNEEWGITLRDMKEHQLKGLHGPERLWQIVAPDLQQNFPPLQSLTEIPNNLPVQLTSFIGREKELEQIKKRLEKNRLVTLTGSGGIGKTRLSIQVASELLDEYPQGVWLVELAPIIDSSLVTQTVCAALNVTLQGNTPALNVLIDYLKLKKILLVVDNCEHLIDASAQLCEVLLHACPDLHIIASSREALGIDGENAYRVPSLLDHAFRLLTGSSRTALRCFSVFVGGWTLEAAEAVCNNSNMLDLLTHLVDKSLVVVDLEHGDESPYDLLEMIRQYAREKLAESGETDLIRDRHLAHFLALAKRAEPEVQGAEQLIEFF